jgi:AraC family transcriptional regulator
VSVPVSWGSQSARQIELRALRLVEMRFAGGMILEPHEHEWPTLAVVLAGGMQGRTGSQDHVCVPSTLRAEPAGVRHSNRFAATGARIVVLQPDPGESLVASATSALRAVTHVRSPRVGVLGRAISRELAQVDDLSALALEGLSLELLAEAARAGRPHPERDSPWLGQVIEYLHENFRGTLRVEDVARAVNVHPAHVARTFRETQGMPLVRYVRQLRIEYAAMRLATSTDPISAIALEAGFADQPHLTRAMRAYLGVTPRRYRDSSRS